MSRYFSGALLLVTALAAGCGGEGDPFAASHPNVRCADVVATTCIEIGAGDTGALLDATNVLTDGTALVLGAGEYVLDNQVTIRNADGVSLIGQGIDDTILDFATVAAQVNGVDAVGDRFLVEGLTVRDAKKDGVRVEDSEVVTIRAVRATWSAGASPMNGAYGIYPVRCTDVLVEDSIAEFASDAGLYVGQCRNVIVRNNVVHDNVAGLEIENTQYADVYGNTAEGNTGGLVVFDLPGNPVVGRDVRIRDNTIRGNNHRNFAPGGTVTEIPAGVGTFALASRRLEIVDNVYEDNASVDVAILSGLIVDSDPAVWGLDRAEVVGDVDDLGLIEEGGRLFNYRSENIVVRGNTHRGGGTQPGGRAGVTGPELGALLFLVYGTTPVDNILYDTIGESAFDAMDPAGNSNDNRLCIGGDEGTFASLDIERLAAAIDGGTFPTVDDLYRPGPGGAPFDCDALEGGAVADVTLPQP